ncbi:MAG: hypothetical protein ACRCXT_00600 [Paraclostridium sp.]
MNEYIDELFSGIQKVDVQQGSDHWKNLRRYLLTSSDTTSIILHHYFKTPDVTNKVEDLYYYKKIDRKFDSYMMAKLSRGKRAEQIIFNEMKASTFIKDLQQAPVFVGKYVCISPDAVCSKKGKFIMYEIKWTDHPNTVWNAIKIMDLTSIHTKKYLIQLFYHIIAYKYLTKSDRYIDGCLVCSFEDDFTKEIVYDYVNVSAYDENGDVNIWIKAIINSAEMLLNTAKAFSEGHENPFVKTISESENTKLNEICNKFYHIKQSLDLLKDEKEAIEAELIDAINQCGVDRVTFKNSIGVQLQASICNRKNIKIAVDDDKVQSNCTLYENMKNDILYTKKRLEELEDLLSESFCKKDVVESKSVRIQIFRGK